MKLYYSPGACSLASHIILQELGVPYELERVDLKTHKTESGKDFYTINPKGYVPTIARDGDVLTEGVPLLLYLASLKPEKKLAILPGEEGFYRQLEWLTFVSAEFHKGLGVIGFAAIDDAGKEILRNKVKLRMDYLEKHLAKNQYLLGERYSVADAYLFTVLNWAKAAKLSLTDWKNIAFYHARIGTRPAVLEAMKKEGLDTAKAA